jgi:hypothetical protein
MMTIEEMLPVLSDAKDTILQLRRANEALRAVLSRAIRAHGPFGDDTRPEWWDDACEVVVWAKEEES